MKLLFSRTFTNRFYLADYYQRGVNIQQVSYKEAISNLEKENQQDLQHSNKMNKSRPYPKNTDSSSTYSRYVGSWKVSLTNQQVKQNMRKFNYYQRLDLVLGKN